METDFFDESEPAQEQVPATIPVVATPATSLATPATDIRQRIELLMLEIDDSAPLEKVQMFLTMREVLRQFLSAMDKDGNLRVVSWIKANGSFMLGETEYYTGPEKKTKCTDVRGAAMALMGITGEIVDPGSGEVVSLENLVDALSTDAFKPATAMKMLGIRAREFFEIVVKDKLKKDLTERSELRKSNTRFIR